MSGLPRWSRKKKKRDPQEAERRLAEGIEHQQAGRLDDAAKAFVAARRADAEHAEAHEMLGGVQLQQGEPERALASLERAIELDPESAGAYVNRGAALDALGRTDEAIDAYRTAVGLNPNSLSAHNNLGNLLAAQGVQDEARRMFERALELDANFFAAAANYARLMAMMTDEQFDVRLAAIDGAIRVARQQGITGSPAARLHHARGLALREVDRPEDAQQEFERAIGLQPSYALAHLNLGRALAAQAKYEAAISPMRKAIELADDPKEAYSALTTLLCRMERMETAGEVLAAWHAADPDDPVAAHMLAAISGRDSPTRASDDYLRREFDEFAEQFEAVLAKLDYAAPDMAKKAIEAHLDGECERILDAGCGTGLCAPFLRPRTRELHGVDLSTKMLEVARKRGAYDELVEAEITAFVDRHPDHYDCIVATDVLIYFGELRELFAGFAKALRPGGLLVVSMEAAAEGVDTWRLNPGGRYEHSEAYARTTLEDAGLPIVSLQRFLLRHEGSRDVPGWLVAARRPSIR